MRRIVWTAVAAVVLGVAAVVFATLGQESLGYVFVGLALTSAVLSSRERR